MRKLDESLPWYRALPAEDRSWVGLVVQAGIPSFTSWFSDPDTPPHGAGEIFAAAPPELTRSISSQHTLQLVRADRRGGRGPQRPARRARLGAGPARSGAARTHARSHSLRREVYARAAEARGAWDARLEALVVDALVRGEDDGALRSRVAALGWSGHGSVLVMVGSLGPAARRGPGRRAAPGGPRARPATRCVGIQGDRLIVVLGGEADLKPSPPTSPPASAQVRS